MRRALAARGFNETVHFSFIARRAAALFGGGDEARQLENPISADLDAMRPSVLPSLLASAARNQARGIAACHDVRDRRRSSCRHAGRADRCRRRDSRRRTAASLDARRRYDADWIRRQGGRASPRWKPRGARSARRCRRRAPSWYHPGRVGDDRAGAEAARAFRRAPSARDRGLRPQGSGGRVRDLPRRDPGSEIARRQGPGEARRSPI